jgi:hypothetical protein
MQDVVHVTRSTPSEFHPTPPRLMTVLLFF